MAVSSESKPRRRTRAQREADEAARRARAEEAEQNRKVTWAVTYGAPIMILDGWNADDGTWHPTSPIGRLLTFISNGAHLSVAAELAGIDRVSNLYSRGAEFLGDAIGAGQDRGDLEPEVRVFADVYRQITIAESWLELDIVKGVRKAIARDPDLGMKFLARRFPRRWREQLMLAPEEERDGTDAAITKAIEDPNVAMYLAKVAAKVEQSREPDDI